MTLDEMPCWLAIVTVTLNTVSFALAGWLSTRCPILDTPHEKQGEHP